MASDYEVADQDEMDFMKKEIIFKKFGSRSPNEEEDSKKLRKL